MSAGLGVLGCGTNVGKTVVTFGLARLLSDQGFDVDVFKPIAVADRQRVIKGRGVSEFGLMRSECLGREYDPNTNPIVVWRVDGGRPIDNFCEDVPVLVSMRGEPPHPTTMGKLIAEHDAICDLVVEAANQLRGRCDFLIVEGAGCASEGGALGSVANFVVQGQFDWPSLLLFDAGSGSCESSVAGVMSTLSLQTSRMIAGSVAMWRGYPWLDEMSLRQRLDDLGAPLKAVVTEHFDLPGDQFGQRLAAIRASNFVNQHQRTDHGPGRVVTDDWYVGMADLVRESLLTDAIGLRR